jgi:predicted amidohydrolase
VLAQPRSTARLSATFSFQLAEAGAEMILASSCTDTGAHALENLLALLQAPSIGMAPWSPALDQNTGRAALYLPPDYGLPANGVLAESAELCPAASRWLLWDLDLEALRRARE